MEVRCFGGLAVSVGGLEVDLGRPKQRLVFALLAIEADRLLMTDRLVRLLWDEDAGPKERAALQAYISNLRRALSGGQTAEGRRIVVHEKSGYRLAVDRSSVDVLCFEDLVTEGLRKVRSGDVEAGAGVLEEALTSWRGDPLPEFEPEPVVFGACERWRELRADAIEELGSIRLGSGAPGAALELVEGALADRPLRERLHQVAAVAFYRSGRQSDALRVLGELRVALRECVGLDPSPDTVRLERQILDHDPALVHRRSAAPAVEVATERNRDAGRLFGRERELALLHDWVLAGRSVVLVGPAGAGKTALAEVALERLSTVLVLRARCPESGARAYWPLMTLLEQLPGAPIGELGLAGGRVPSRADAFVVARSISTVLQQVDAHVVLLVDDLQWADVDTIRVLTHVVGDVTQTSVSIVVVSRPPQADEPVELTALRAEMARSGAATLELGPLDDQAIEAWVNQRVGAADQSTAHAVRRRSGGNALFAGELIELLAQHPEDDADQVLRSIPPGVRAVVRRRIGQLEPAAQHLLSVASILAPTFEVVVLADIAGQAPSDVLRALDPAVSAGILTPDPTGGSLTFCHDLVAEALADELTPGRCAELHAAAARSMARRRPDDRFATEVAYHAAKGVVAGSGDIAIAAARRAAHVAEIGGAYSEAARLRNIVVTVLRQQSHPDPASLLRALLEAARAHERDDEMAAAVEHVRHSLRLAHDLGDVGALAQAAAVLGHPSIFPNQPYGVVDHELVDLLEAALDRCEGRSHAQVSIRCALVTELFHSSDTSRRRRHATAAVEGARRLGDHELLVRALHAEMFDRKTPGELESRLEAAKEMVELTGATASTEDVQVLALVQAALCELSLGNFHDVAARLESCRPLTNGPIGSALRSQVAFLRSHLALITGDLEAARELGDDAYMVLRRSRPHEAPSMRLAQELSFPHLSGDLDRVIDRVRQLPEGAAGYGTALRLLGAAVLADRGRPQEARSLMPLDPGPTGDTGGDYLTLFEDAARAIVAAETSDHDTAAILRQRLHPFSGRWVSAGAVGGSLGFVDLILARIDATTGDEENARTGFEHAVGLHRAAGATTWLGWARLHQARFLLEVGDGQRARDALDDAETAAHSTGALALAEQVERTRS